MSFPENDINDFCFTYQGTYPLKPYIKINITINNGHICWVWVHSSFFSFGKKSSNGNAASNFWRKFPIFSKRIGQTSHYFVEHVTTSLSIAYNFTDPVQKCRQLKWNLCESVCWYSPVLLQYKNEKQLNWCWYIRDHHRLVCVCHLWELVTILDPMLEVHVDGVNWLSMVFLILWLA